MTDSPIEEAQQLLKEALDRMAAGDVAVAERLLREALARSPDDPDVLYNLGLVMTAAGRMQEALPLARRASDAAPDNPNYLRLLAIAQVQTGHTRRGMRNLERLLALASDDAEMRYLYAAQHRNRGNFGEAMEQLSAVIEHNPEHVGALVDTGAIFAKLGKLDEARSAFARAVRLAADNADIWSNLGNVQVLQGDFDEAIPSFEKALAFDGTHAGACNGLVVALRRGGRPEESATRARALLEKRPNDARLWNLLGTAERESGRLAEARYAYERALAADPALTTARLNRAMVDLLEGDWRAAWPDYEMRLQEAGAGAQRHFPQPRWSGEPLAGKTLLLHAEQGIGDTLQFCRFAPVVAAQAGGRVVLECPPTLAPLLQTLDGVEAVVPRGGPLPHIDFQLPLMSVPGALDLTPGGIPAEVPYLTAGPCPTALGDKLAASSGRRIGLVWRGNPEHLEDWKRSLPFGALAPLLALDGVVWVSLQLDRDDACEPLPENAVDAAPDLESFADTAAVLAALDEVVCCDTAVAHLAGALDVPCRLMLPFVPDWRWGLRGEETPWYPRMRLYRQPALHDWESVVAAVAEDLSNAS